MASSDRRVNTAQALQIRRAIRRGWRIRGFSSMIPRSMTSGLRAVWHVSWWRVALGAAAFGVAHSIVQATWSGPYEAWWLNSDRGGSITMAVMFVAGLVQGSRAPIKGGLSLALGGSIAMTVVLFRLTAGPGTIFPFVLAFGAALLSAAAVAGAYVGWRLSSRT